MLEKHVEFELLLFSSFDYLVEIGEENFLKAGSMENFDGSVWVGARIVHLNFFLFQKSILELSWVLCSGLICELRRAIDYRLG